MLSHVLKLFQKEKKRPFVKMKRVFLTSKTGQKPKLRCSHLVDVVEFEVFQKQQQDGRDGFDNDFFVAIHINAEFHALQNRRPAASRKTPVWLNPSQANILTLTLLSTTLCLPLQMLVIRSCQRLI